MLRRNPSLTDQAKSYIKEQILNDEFENGRIPSEMDLADQLQVSRTTIRQALSRLEAEGVIYRKQGAGTFVNKPGLQIKTRLEEIWSYEDVLQDHGYTPTIRILDVSTGPAPAEIAVDLDLAAGAQVLTVQKLFLADSEPVILAFNHIPATHVERPYRNDDFLSPIYQFLTNHCRQHLSYYLSDIVPTIATPELGAILRIKPQTALISFAEVGYNTDNEPILKSYSYFRDDLLRLRLIRRQL